MSNLIDWIRHWTSDTPNSNGKAVHVCNGEKHAVVFDSLRVLIVKDDEGLWFAQSCDIDYASSGKSLEDVQRNFELGLSETIKAHLEHFGNIDRIMRTPAQEDWRDLLDKSHGDYGLTMVAQHKIEDKVEGLPYSNIAFYQEKEAA